MFFSSLIQIRSNQNTRELTDYSAFCQNVVSMKDEFDFQKQPKVIETHSIT